MATLAEKQSEYHNALSAIYDVREARTITQWVIEDVMKIRGVALSMDRFLILTTHQEEILDQYLTRLLSHEPIQYVLGHAEFYGLDFKVNNSVLIPRPETEELVEWIQSDMDIEDEKTHQKSRAWNDSPNILDIGTGSGCIAITLKRELPKATVTAVDISTDALTIAKENTVLNKVDVKFLQLDILKQIPEPSIGYDIIVSNPPYIDYVEENVMSQNVLDFEPHIALFAEDPLIFYKRIAKIGHSLLNADGMIYLETSEFRATEVKDIFSSEGYTTILKKDMSGRERMVCAYLF